MQRVLVTVLLILALLGGGYVAIRALLPESTTTSAQVYATQPVARGDIRVAVEGFGNLEPSFMSSITAAAEGEVEAVYVERGQRIEEGQLVALIRNDQLGFQLSQAEIEVERLRADLARLLGVNPDRVLDVDPTSEIIVRASHAGRVEGLSVFRDGTSRPVAPGLTVENNEEIARIVDDSKLIITALLLPGEYEQVAVGNQVEIHLAQFDGYISGTITDINHNPIADQGRYVYRATVEIPHPGLLQPGLETNLYVLNGDRRIPIREPQFIDRFGDETRLYAPAKGTVTRVHVQPGSQVQTGDPIISLGGQASAEFVQQLQFELRQKELELEQKQDIQDRLEVRSPITGTVAFVSAEPGWRVEPGWHLASIFDNKKMNLHIRIDEVDVVHIQEGMEAHITVEAMPGRSWTGQVITVDMMGRAEDGIAQYGVFIEVDDTSDLKPGMTANVEIFVGEKKNVLLIPIEAVFEHDGQVVVEVLGDDGRPVMVPVELGLADDRQAEVTAGLEEGQEVVVGSLLDRLEGQPLDPAQTPLPGIPSPSDGEPMPIPEPDRPAG